YAQLQRRDYECFTEIRAYADPAHATDARLVERWKNALRGRQRLLYELEERVVQQAALDRPDAEAHDATEVLPQLQAHLAADTAVLSFWPGGAPCVFLVTAHGLQT